MIITVMWICILIAAIAVLVKSADFFTQKAEELGISLNISPFVVGVTIVAIGTSLPELVSSFIAVANGAPGIVVGNALGSNIANVFLVLGFASLFARKATFKHKHLIKDLNILLLVTLLVVFFFWDGKFDFFEAVFCTAIFAGYLTYTIVAQKGPLSYKGKKAHLSFMWWFLFLASCVGIYFGAQFTVQSVIELSLIFGIGESIIAASIVAIGTSLPELVVSIIAARKGNLDIAVGNILGSNVFNLLAVIGLSGLFGTLFIGKDLLFLMLSVLLIATVMFVIVCYDKKLKKWEGILLLAFYALFLIKLFI